MQTRKAPTFVSKDNDTDEQVFLRRQYLYGVEARYAVGFGFHQLAYGSKSALDITSYAAARAAMGSQRKPDGSSMNIKPTHLIVGPTGEAAARAVLKTEYAGGESNTWFNTAELVVIPALG